MAVVPSTRARGLEARTAPPLPPANFVERLRLRDQIESAVPLGVALIVAPGGFGKTVALADFARHAPFPVAWLSVSPADADLVAFVEALTGAFRAVASRIGRRALLLARQGGNNATAAVADELAGELSAYGQPIGLALDDFHHLDGAREVTRMVGALLERMPSTMFVAIASRTLPALPHARLLAAGRLLGVAAEDLRFSLAEVATFVGGRVNPERAFDASEGWAAALALGGEIGTDPGALGDYLETEVLGQQAPEMRDFLLLASVPPILTDDVCERILNRPRGPVLLSQAHRAGLFVAALPEGGWRLHDLFRDFLRTYLRRHNPELWAALHRAVAEDLRSDRRSAEAITLLIDAGLHDDAADLLLAHADELADGGRWGAIRRWFERLPSRVTTQRPRLLTLHGRALRPIADAETVLHRFDEAIDGCLAAGDEIGAADALGHRASRLALSGRNTEANTDAARVHELLAGRDHRILATVLRVQGVLQAYMGQWESSFRLLREALEIAQRQRQTNEAATCERGLGWTYSQIGEYGAATAHYQRAIHVLEDLGDVAAAADVKINLGHVYREQGAAEAARRAFEDVAAQAERIGQQRALGFALDNLGAIERESGRIGNSIEHLDAALRVARESDDAHLLTQCLDQLAQTHRIGGQGPAWAEVLARQAIAEAERAGLAPIAARARATLAATLLAQHRAEDAWSIACTAAEALEERGARLDVVRARLTAAKAGHCAGKGAWTDDLRTAASLLEQVQNRGFLRAEVLCLGDWLKSVLDVSDASVAASAILTIAEDATSQLVDAIPATAPRGRALPKIDANLLGQPDVLVDGAPPRGDKYSWGRQATRELFFLLEAHRQGLAADVIIDRLWPEAAPGAGQAQLWTTVHRLRSALGNGDRELGKRMVMAERGSYRLNPELALSTDAAGFEATAQRALSLPPGAPEGLEALQAADLSYGGEYLRGIDATWAIPRRRDLARLHAAVLRRLVELTLDRSRSVEATALAERLIKAEPFNERACELLIRAHLATGDRERARLAYRRFARRLERHLDVAPPTMLGQLVGL